MDGVIAQAITAGAIMQVTKVEVIMAEVTMAGIIVAITDVLELVFQ